MNWSQENCLFSNHRLTCERWEGDLLIVNINNELFLCVGKAHFLFASGQRYVCFYFKIDRGAKETT